MRDLQPVHERDLPRRSPRLVGLFSRYVNRYVRKRFNAVRVLDGTWPTIPADEPVVFYANHPGWWDPLVLMVVAMRGYAGRRHFAPLDEAMLRKYGFFEWLGFFGVAQESRRGAARFLRVGEAILAASDTALWVTAEGRFRDVRDRPLDLRRGLAHLAHRAERGWFVPVALEYGFWSESTPEAMVAFGPALEAGAPVSPDDSAGWQEELTRRLGETMDSLAAAAKARDASAFETLLAGRRGIGGVYDVWRRGKAFVRGERFDPAHMDSGSTDARREVRS